MHDLQHLATIERIKDTTNRANFLRLDMNESPEGLPREFVESVKQEITASFLATYPNDESFLQALARFLEIPRENLCATNGSDMAIRYCFELFGHADSTFVSVYPTFEMYAVYCNIFRLNHRKILYEDDFSIDVHAILESITDDVSMVALLNPNNPIGNVYAKNEVESIIKKAKDVGAIVIIDEAYYGFAPQSFLPLALKHDNVLVLRTFSKLFALASLRLGFVCAHPKMIATFQKIMPTFEVNALALLFGQRLLENHAIIESLQQTQQQGRETLMQLLQQAHYDYKMMFGNYLFIRPHSDVATLVQRLKEHNILIKTYRHAILKDMIRITTGSPKTMQHFFDIFYEIDNRTMGGV